MCSCILPFLFFFHNERRYQKFSNERLVRCFSVGGNWGTENRSNSDTEWVWSENMWYKTWGETLEKGEESGCGVRKKHRSKITVGGEWVRLFKAAKKKKKRWWRRRKIEALVFLSQHLKIPYCSVRHKHLLPWLFVPLRRLRPVPLRPLVIMMHQVCNVWLCPFVYKYTWWEEKSLQCKVIISSKRHQASVFSLLCLFCLFL